MAEKLEFELLIKNNQLLNGLNEAIKKSEGLGAALSTALGVVGGTAVTKAFELVGDAMGAVIGFSKESIKAYSEQEDALNKLSAVLKASGEFSNAALSDFSAFATEMMKTANVGDELVLSQIAVAKAFGATNNTAKEVVRAAANLSAVFGGDLESNVEKIGKTLNGNVGKLGQYIDGLKNLTKEQLAAGEAAKVINAELGDQAAAKLNTYSGKVEAAAIAYGEMQEEVGKFITQNTITKGVVDVARAAFEKLGGALNAVNNYLGIGLEPQEQQRRKLAELGQEYNKLRASVDNARISMETNAKFGGDRSGEAKTIQNISAAEQRMNDILKERMAIRTAMRQDSEVKAKETNTNPVDEKIVEGRQKLNDQLLNLDKQLELEKENFADQQANLKIVKEQTKAQEELQRMREYDLQKVELDFELKEAEAKRIEDHETRKLTLQKLAKEKEIALLKANNSIIKREDDQRVKDAEKAKANELAIEQQKAAMKLGMIGSVATLGTALLRDGSREQFLVSKAAAVAQTIIAMNEAAAKALVFDPTGGLSSWAYAQGAINLAAIAATAIKGYATGGIIGTAGSGATMGGDNTIINAREGEMVLNADQQKVVYDALTSGGFGNAPIVVQIDGREIARAMRNMKNSGYRI